MYKNPALLIKFCSIGFFKIKNSLKLRKHQIACQQRIEETTPERPLIPSKIEIQVTPNF